jgi:hypothetical protein
VLGGVMKGLSAKVAPPRSAPGEAASGPARPQQPAVEPHGEDEYCPDTQNGPPAPPLSPAARPQRQGSTAAPGGAEARRLWTTVSRRWADSADAGVHAFVKTRTGRHDVFSIIELLRLLHDPEVRLVIFHSPQQRWVRHPADPEAPAGRWRGAPIAGRADATDGGRTLNLHATDGIRWTPSTR